MPRHPFVTSPARDLRRPRSRLPRRFDRADPQLYYDETCNANGGDYECSVAPELCRRFPDDNSTESYSDPIGNWSECVRQCLQERHEAQMEDPAACNEDNQIDLGDNTTDHAKCFVGCAQNPENPYDSDGPPLPDATPSLYD